MWASTRAISAFSASIRSFSSSIDIGSRSCFASATSGSSGLLGKRSSRSTAESLTRPSAQVNKPARERTFLPRCWRWSLRSPTARKSWRWSSGRCRGPGPARCWSRSRQRASTAPTSSSAAASIRRRRERRTSSASRSPAKWSRRARAPKEFVGQKVCALVAGGGYAEYCVAPIGPACRCPTRSRWSRRRRCRRPCSPSGRTCSSAALRPTATGYWSTAAPAGSARWRSRSDGCSA